MQVSYCHTSSLPSCFPQNMTFRGPKTGEKAYRDDSPQSFQDISLRAAIQKFLELARGQHLRGGLVAHICGIASGFEGQVSGCSERPVSKVRRVHSWRKLASVQLKSPLTSRL